MTFKEYLSTRPVRYDTQGDFVRLARADGDSLDASSWDELRTHMERSGTPSQVVDAGKRVWLNYMRLEGKPQRA